VILIDANILIYAHVTSFAQHKLARDWLDRQLNASVPVGLPWASVLGFLRLVTNPHVFERPGLLVMLGGKCAPGLHSRGAMLGSRKMHWHQPICTR
jgi:hypothetical protein